MPIATCLAIGLGVAGAAASAGASIYGASKQAGAANDAASLSFRAQEDALNYQKQKDALNQKNLAPWLSAGQGAITSLSGMLQNGQFPDWNEQFQAPTNVTEQNDPGYQFRLQQGQQAIERSAAARGGVLSGGTAKALTQYGQDYASNEYGNVYNRAFNEYATRYNQFEQNQSNKFNRYASIAGVGQTAANQIGTLGQQSAGNVGNILMSGAQQQGNALQNAAYQTASGYNAAAGQIGNIGGYLSLYNLLNQQNNQSGFAGV